jgi:hypothetical protein
MARRKNPETEAPVDPSDIETAQENEGAALPDAMVGAVEPSSLPEPAQLEASQPERLAEPTVPAPRRSGLFGPILGGALAAVGGFALSHFDAFGLGPADSSAAVAAMADRVAALESQFAETGQEAPALRDALSGLQARLAALETAPAPEAPDLSALDQRLAAIEALPKGGDASTAALAAKLAEVERRLAALPEGGVDTEKVEAALKRLEAAEAEAAARAKAASEAAAVARRTAALDGLRQAAASGGPFEVELAALDDPTLAAGLGPHAAGVATVAALQADFPDLARQALAQTRAASADQGWGARLIAFLAGQTGARPLTPQDGDTPDAILSRADFAVGEGRLADALAEIGTLPDDVRAVFDGWTPRAEARIAVDTALEAQ